MSIESEMASNHLILCLTLLLLPSIFPSIRVFSNESVLRIRWPKYWSFSFNISPSNEYSALISFRIDWFDLLAVQGTLKKSSPAPQFESINSSALSSLDPPKAVLSCCWGCWSAQTLPHPEKPSVGSGLFYNSSFNHTARSSLVTSSQKLHNYHLGHLKIYKLLDFPDGQVDIHIPNAGGPGSIPGQGTKSHMLQLKVQLPQLKDPSCAKEDGRFCVQPLKPSAAEQASPQRQRRFCFWSL